MAKSSSLGSLIDSPDKIDPKKTLSKDLEHVFSEYKIDLKPPARKVGTSLSGKRSLNNDTKSIINVVVS
jgi:hypothetical protein